MNAAVLPSIFLQLEFGFKTGGPVVMVYGWLMVAFFTILIGSSLAEISSTYPVSGGLYYQAGALASRENAPLASYVTGWLYLGGGVIINVSFA